MRLLVVVTHLLGAGHLTRAAALARAVARRGHAVTLVSGGLPAPLVSLDGVAFVQLPPVRIQGTDFGTLLDEAGRPFGPERLADRADRLGKIVRDTRPNAMVTELFPFGRRVLAGEFLKLLEAADDLARRPLVAASIRDILVAPGRPERVEETHRRLERFYDLVLVHGDPDLVPLDASWPAAGRIAPMLRHTGYVDEGPDPVAGGPRAGIVVSGGSSAASLPLYRAAIRAAGLIPHRPWTILVGHGVAAEAFERLRGEAPPNAAVERARSGFRAVLAGAELSISQAGYNTAVDLLRAEVPAVLVPFEAGNESEQRLRAEEFRRRGLAEVVLESGLSPETVAAAARQALSRPRPSLAVRLDGAERSADILEDAYRTSTRSRPARSAPLWEPLYEAVRRAAEAGCPLAFWWRDDDAVAPSPALERLLALSRRYRIPVAVAAVPGRAEASLGQRIAEEEGASLLVHGLVHRNHAPAGEKKAEFGPHRSLDARRADAAEALALARERLGPRCRPVLVPPWNRIAPDLVPHLPSLGYAGLSTARNRPVRAPAPDLVQANVHLDPVDWQGSRSVRAPEHVVADLSRAILERTERRADRDEPIGLLTHHLIHDEALWHLTESLLDRLSRSGAFRYPVADELFSTMAPRVAIEPQSSYGVEPMTPAWPGEA